MRRLLLIGAGHAHALVLADWSQRPLPDIELVLVATDPCAPYSGMVPGWLAGTYRYDQIVIDVAALTSAIGARLVIDEMVALDPARRRVHLASGATIDYDLLSLNIGSTQEPQAVADCSVLPLRPLGALRAEWESLLSTVQSDAADRPLRLTAVGGGAAGFESLLAVLARLRALQPARPITASLVGSAGALLPELAPGARRAAARALARAGVQVHLGTTWREGSSQVPGPGVDERRVLLWAGGALAPRWQRDADRRGSLATGEQGFVRVDPQLRSVSHPEVFAAGDCAEFSPPLPKAGVYAVRMAPVLARNLRAALHGGELSPFVPQRRFLALLATGDGRAIGSRGRLWAEGRWLWRWKDRIDRGFLRRFDASRIGPSCKSSKTGPIAGPR
jgi:pyridine nucleotide-disulfide oxidoreductase family protein